MATNLGLSSTVPVLEPIPILPVTGIFALSITVYGSWLNMRVLRYRNEHRRCVKNCEEERIVKQQERMVQMAIRSNENWTQKVPFDLVLAAVAEINGGDPMVLTFLMSILMFCRITHYDIVIARRWYKTSFFAFYGTMATMGGMAGYAAYLS
ncbi:hypothetical protein F5Y16DRAFT_388303 [Xylariaceae sp. FL0255]|nr:hypothetical protein F5Y16DRAFT_388303 [Xylariaceae sp. FL0255]